VLARIQFEAVVGERGELTPTGSRAISVRARLQRYKGRASLVTVEPERKRRSLKQNAYLWGVVYTVIAAWSGHNVEEIHEAMKALHLPMRELMTPTGEVLPLVTSTTRLDSLEFTEYVGRVKLWAGEQGLYVPEPDEL